MVGHDRPELARAPELPAPVADPATSSPTLGPMGVIRPGSRIPVPPDLPADRGRRATESGGDRTDAETGDVGRFRSPDAFAALAGVAPIPASSGQIQRVRLSRGGNRQLNRAFYVIALTQVWHHPPAKAYVARKRAEGKTWREAIRCLKRQLVRPVFRLLQEGQLGLQAAARQHRSLPIRKTE